MHNFTTKIDGKFIRITHPSFGKFNIPLFNTKVRVPIINVEPAKECCNKSKCPFSTQNFKKTGYPWCYSQKIETVFPNTFKWKKENDRMLGAIAMCNEMTEKLHILDLIEVIVDALLLYAPFVPYVRMNESGDINDENIFFFEQLQKGLNGVGRKLYGYTKSDEKHRKSLNDLGACVIKSEKDFVMVDSEEERVEKGYRICPGVCGVCQKCMNFKDGDKPIGVVRH
jgi:hypothetical protein